MKGVFEKKEYFGLKCHEITGFRGFPPMFHPHAELIYIKKGSLVLFLDGEKIALGEGDLAVVFPYLVHSYENAPQTETVLALFDPSETAFDNSLLTKKPSPAYLCGREFAPLLERMAHHRQNGRTKTALAYLNAVLGEFFEKTSLVFSDRRTENSAIRILSYCSEHFAENITVESVAKALYVSQSYVSKIFNRELQYGFREYVNSLRIQKASALLSDTDRRIVDVMLDCGFQNQSSFNRIFKAKTGLSPADYRERNRRMK